MSIIHSTEGDIVASEENRLITSQVGKVMNLYNFSVYIYSLDSYTYLQWRGFHPEYLMYIFNGMKDRVPVDFYSDLLANAKYLND